MSFAGVFGDMLYGKMMLPKETEIEESNFKLGFQVLDFGLVINMSVIFLHMTYAWLPYKNPI